MDGVSLAKPLLIYYAIMAGFNSDLLGKQFHEMMQTSRMAKHVAGFVMMMGVIEIMGKVEQTDMLVFYSLIGYIWFILSTKVDLQWNLILLVLLGVWYVYQNRQVDMNLNEADRNKILRERQKLDNYVTIGLMMVTLVGMLLYTNKKTVQYGGGRFDPIRFIFY
jgi:hypothetical protein